MSILYGLAGCFMCYNTLTHGLLWWKIDLKMDWVGWTTFNLFFFSNNSKLIFYKNQWNPAFLNDNDPSARQMRGLCGRTPVPWTQFSIKAKNQSWFLLEYISWSTFLISIASWHRLRKYNEWPKSRNAMKINFRVYPDEKCWQLLFMMRTQVKSKNLRLHAPVIF